MVHAGCCSKGKLACFLGPCVQPSALTGYVEGWVGDGWCVYWSHMLARPPASRVGGEGENEGRKKREGERGKEGVFSLLIKLN